jgi:DNA-binding NarL/FixJ family response regulator
MLSECAPFHLSDREREIVRARSRGLAIKQVADELGISSNTVKTHLHRVFLKLDIECSLELLHRMQPEACENCRLAIRAANTRRVRKMEKLTMVA